MSFFFSHAQQSLKSFRHGTPVAFNLSPKRLQTPCEVFSVKENRVKYSSNPDALLIHGLFGSKVNFRSFSKLLHSPRVINVDLRNHGESQHVDSMTYYEMATDIVRTLDAFDLQNAAIIGHSLGGKVAMTVALEFPERVSHLVSMDMPPADFRYTGLPRSSDGYTTKHIVDFLSSLNLGDVKNSKDVAEKIEQRAPWMSPALRAFLLQKLKRVKSTDGALCWNWEMNLPVISRDFVSELCKWPYTGRDIRYYGPSLFVKGSRSNWIKDGAEGAVLQHFPTALFAKVDAGHWVHSENPFDTAKCINDFLYAGESHF